MQIRTMEQQPPPVYVDRSRPRVPAGRPPTHAQPVFHQVEGLAVDEGITFADLKGTLAAFARAMFGADTEVRFVPDFFPFVEPGPQVEVCVLRVRRPRAAAPASGTGWIELLGAGMVHPNVLRNVGYDPERYTGFAFGMRHGAAWPWRCTASPTSGCSTRATCGSSAQFEGAACVKVVCPGCGSSARPNTPAEELADRLTGKG